MGNISCIFNEGKVVSIQLSQSLSRSLERKVERDGSYESTTSTKQ